MKVEEIKIGTPVTYYSVIEENGEKTNPKPTFITSKPWTLGHGDIVCKVDGVSGGVLISHLEKREIVVKAENTPRIKTQTIQDWKKEAEAKFGPDHRLWRFKCPQCGGIQTLADFEDNKIDNAKDRFFFSCIGRWVKGRGCDWTLGGLFQIHKSEVINAEGEKCPVFEFADEQQTENTTPETQN